MSKSIFIIMGVSGTGKTTIGTLLADALSIPFFDGDDYHPKENVSKMKLGNALDDNDRYGWLAALNELAIENKIPGAVIACSALKEKYRTQLQTNLKKELAFVYLDGTFDQIKSRLDNRKGHFMTSALLKSQFDTLESPKDAIKVAIALTPKEIIKEILNQLKC